MGGHLAGCLLLLFLCSGLVPVTAAETTDRPPSTTPSATTTAVPTLAPVTVVGVAAEGIDGRSELTGDVLPALPQKNSSITETITILPRVQIGEGQRTSENAGEILPPLISISGGRAYENNYTVDGLNINSLLDPLSGNTYAESIRDIPSHPQRSFIHQDLIDSVKVYDSNIPARYGGFLGGVIAAETRQPAAALGARVNLRTTRDSWTRFHISADRLEDFNRSEDHLIQPRFTKYDAGLEVDLPLNETMAVLAAYKILRSNLEIVNIDDWETKSKTLENYFLKYAWQPRTPFAIELTAEYTPSEEEFFIENTRDSDIEIDRGGFSIGGKLTGDLSFGVLEASLAYLYNESSRKASPLHFFWPSQTPSKPWGEEYGLPYSAEGGYGDVDQEEESYQARVDFVANPLPVSQVVNTFNMGIEFSHDDAVTDRRQPVYEHALNRAELDAAVVCSETDVACIDGEAYFRERRLYDTEHQQAKINSLALYLDDLVEIGRFSFRPGVRVTYDDFMENFDAAYRFAASWDLFGHGTTRLKGGFNRYYGRPLLTYKLREGRRPYQKQVRTINPDGTLTDWAPDADQSLIGYNYSTLDTPYSDEKNIGLVQSLFHGNLELNYLERDNHDQFAKDLLTTEVDGRSVFGWQLNNNGSSKYKSTKISWERQWRDHYFNINYTHSDQETSNESYDETFDEDDLETSVWYQGQLIRLSDLPRSDYNREDMLNIIYTGRLPWNLTFTNVTRYRSGYEALEDTRENITLDSGERYDVYDWVKHSDYWIFDWRLAWQTKTFRNQSMVLSLEIDNVFDRTPAINSAGDLYELGRQFWLGMTYSF